MEEPFLEKEKLKVRKFLTYNLDQVKEQLSKLPINRNVKVSVLHVGTNDVGRKGNPMEQVIEESKEVIDLMCSKFPNAKILYSNIVDREDDQTIQAKLDLINADLNFFFLGAERVSVCKNNNIGRHMRAKDKLHLNKLGVLKTTLN